MQNHAIRIHEFGGPDVMRFEPVEVPSPGPGEALVRHTAVSLNFIDVYHRTGLYPVPLPSGLGQEAAGIIEAVGADVSDLAPGDRVAYAGGPLGAYAERRTIKADLLVPLPDEVSDEVASAIMLKGLTAWYLLHHSYPVKPGDKVLLYAAAGGVGSIATQWAKALGATVIGIVGSEEKAAIATELGCDHVLRSDNPDIPAAVRELTEGKGVAAVYDSVGRDTFMTSLDCLRPHGVMVSFGNSSGAVEPFAPAELAKRGSLYVTRPTLAHFVPNRTALLAAASSLFAFVRDNNTIIRIGQEWPLARASDAHRALEARETTGSSVLIPDQVSSRS